MFSGDDGDDRTTIKMIELMMLMNRWSGQAMQGCRSTCMHIQAHARASERCKGGVLVYLHRYR